MAEQTTEKSALQSKTIIGGIVMILALVLQHYNISIDAAGWTQDIMGIVGAVLVFYGRVNANTKITSLFSKGK